MLMSHHHIHLWLWSILLLSVNIAWCQDDSFEPILNSKQDTTEESDGFVTQNTSEKMESLEINNDPDPMDLSDSSEWDYYSGYQETDSSEITYANDSSDFDSSSQQSASDTSSMDSLDVASEPELADSSEEVSTNHLEDNQAIQTDYAKDSSANVNDQEPDTSTSEQRASKSSSQVDFALEEYVPPPDPNLPQKPIGIRQISVWTLLGLGIATSISAKYFDEKSKDAWLDYKTGPLKKASKAKSDADDYALKRNLSLAGSLLCFGGALSIYLTF